MKLRPEVVRVLEREKMISEKAIAHIRDRSRLLEQRYGWSTDEFLRKFNTGELGDDQEFFLWYALAEAVKDWEKTCGSLEELLTGSELVSA